VSEDPTTPERFRAAAEAFGRGDFDAALVWYAPDAVVDVSLLGLEGVFEGREAIRGLFEDSRAPYEHVEAALEDFRDLGNGVTFVVLYRRGRLRESNAMLVRRDGHVAIWRDGLISRDTVYADLDEARAAAERLAEERG
jgi:ketosteroid isomerase-like protein